MRQLQWLEVERGSNYPMGSGFPGPPIDDSIVDHLIALKQLKMLFVFDTSMSPAGMARLQKALPNTRIDGPYYGPR